ncbi:amidohydrolase [bacterium]|nr:amidohydrolase [bacterium]
MAYIDCHVHVWTDEFARFPLAPGFSPEEMEPPVFTPEDLIAVAEPCDVDRIVLVQMSYYGTDNSYMLDAIRTYPGVFGGIAVIDPNAADVEEHMTRLAEEGVRGFRIQPGRSPAGDWLDTPGYHRMFARAASTGQSLCCLINPDSLPALDRMCTAYPQTPVVIDHLCRLGIEGDVREEDVTALCALARHGGVKVKVSAFYALGRKRPPHEDLLPLIERVVAAFGARRLMWGSDCPYQVQNETYEDGLALVRDRLTLPSADDRDWLLWRTAEETFF